VAPLPAIEVQLEETPGLVLARDVVAPADLPRWDNSSMDGYAVRWADVALASAQAPVSLAVLADLPAGSSARPVLGPGSAARIMTGAMLPVGADAVVPVEHTDAGLERVLVSQAPEPGAYIRRAGGDVRAGTTILTAGTVLGPVHVAAAAAAGCDHLPVHRRPRVAVLSTGSELVEPGTELELGQIPDSNSFLLAAAVRECGGEAVRIGVVPDVAASLRAVFDELDGTVDLVITSGGVSKGAYDVVKEVLEPEPGMSFVEVAMQPGKPQGIGRLAHGTPVFALPGNPVSVLVSFEVFVRAAVLRLCGRTDIDRHHYTGVVMDGWRNRTGRTQFMPITFESEESAMQCRIRSAGPGGSESHLVASLARAEGLAVVEAGVEVVRSGDRLPVTRLDR
jgi:molybdopterin molybdotransferase